VTYADECARLQARQRERDRQKRQIGELHAAAQQMQARVEREDRPTYGTTGMWRWANCVLLATVAQLSGGLPPGSVVVIADAFTTGGDPRRDCFTRRTWVELPDGGCWEPVDCTVRPRELHYELSKPQASWRYAGPGELAAAIHQAAELPAQPGETVITLKAHKSRNFGHLEPLCGDLGLPAEEVIVRLNRMINSGVPEGGVQYAGGAR
jgi:hypothetical protein